MVYIILGSIFGVVWLATLITFIVLYKKKHFAQDNGIDQEKLQALFANQKEQNQLVNNMIMQQLKNSEVMTQNTINGLTVLQKQEFDSISKRVDDLTARNEQRIEKLTYNVNTALNSMSQQNEKQLEKMRETVDEKLNNSLSQRLNDSFSKIQQSLESVNLGIGEMRTLANGVGDLKRVLGNVKVRGGWGEVMLSSLLDQMLAPSQYKAQVQIKKNSKERVDFVVIMPGKDENEVYLPIDSKFPLEDYNRLVEASETMDKDAIEHAQKQLMKRIKEEAKSIKEKYINVPKTTDFAVMYLSIEGLYAEVLRRPGLAEALQRDYKINVCGPTTLASLLNSLQMGFRTLTIEKRTSEVWNLLGAVKQE